MSKAKYVPIGMLFIIAATVLLMWPQNKFPQIQTYHDVQQIFDACNQETLITFDVDDTLITTRDHLARDLEFSLWFKIRVALTYPSLLFDKTKKDWLFSIGFEQAERFVFDPEIVQIIRALQAKKIPVLALTSMESGSLGIIKDMPEWRARMLKNFSIDFQGQFDDAVFTALPTYRNNYPCLYKGVLCANQIAKGKVLGAFLDHHHVKPAHIISFDDRSDALNSIAQECTQRKIAFSGYQILGAKKLQKEWCAQRALMQLDYVMHTGRWLTDEQADLIRAKKHHAHA